MEKSLLNHAYDFVSSQKSPVGFDAIWKYVVSEAQLTPEEAEKKVSRFYTNLMLDGRFVTLGENQWDLRSNHTFDKVHIDMRDVYSDVEATEDDDEEEKIEEKEYNEVFEESKDEDDEGLESEESENEDE
ncbi:MAG: DNA-directed RNA polymerase subunit delta [Bacilli bacterium]|nr:DNA-directed RNA polymerase subunit delta [Bacilli bacterium]